jgi:diaminopimelate epimerase
MRFSKWHALGNSYLLLERAETGVPLEGSFARRLCDSHVGVGADGVLEVVATDGSMAEVVIWNPDGSTAELSGNGTRIAARWLALRSGAQEVVIRVGPREVHARIRHGDLLETDVGPVEVGSRETIDLAGESVELTPVSVGNPHAVLAREPDRAELLRLGPEIERHPRFPERTNVQFARVDGPSDVTALVWERGAGETPSSGTSAVAVAAAGTAVGSLASPVTVRLPGGELVVELDASMNARVTGPAEELCRGELAGSLRPTQKARPRTDRHV